MQIKDVRPESFTKQIRCDRCGRLSELGDVEFHESASIELKAGYGSIFGDGNDVQVDLCQHCLKDTLGPWLRVSDPDDRGRVLQESLLRFDVQRHGGEFPTSADRSEQVELSRDARWTTIERAGKDQAFAEALLDEASNLLRAGDRDSACLILEDLLTGMRGARQSD